METLDRRISASTDQLDTLKREKRANKMWNENNNIRASSRPAASRPRSVMANKKSSPLDDEVTFRINGEKMSKSKYFFGAAAAASNLQLVNKKQTQPAPTEGDKKRKTAVDIFLEDKGPYSRKLYGPPPEENSASQTASTEDNKNSRSKRARSQEQLEVGTIFCFT